MKSRTKLLALIVPLALTSMSLVMLAWLVAAGVAQAAGTCDVPSATHATIQNAVDDTGCGTVNLIGALYTENITVTRSVTIQGQGALSTTVDGNASGSVFTIQSGLAVTITDVTITNGEAPTGGGIYNIGSNLVLYAVSVISSTATDPNSYGGGITNAGTLTVTNSIIKSNSAYRGGGISNDGTLLVAGSTISGNLGGGIYNELGCTVQVIDSTISGNLASSGGGIRNEGSLRVVNSTLSGNSAVDGGGISNRQGGALTVINSTISENSSDVQWGAGVHNQVASTELVNSVIANNLNGGNCWNNPIFAGDITSLGHNLDSDNTCNLTAAGDITNSNPVLGPLQDNGGSTMTHALSPLSPAVDAGDDAACPATDQRGVSRPQDGDGDSVSQCDIGAYEYQHVIHETFLPVALNNYCVDYSDDFSNPSSGWPVSDNGNIRREYLSGEYRILIRNANWLAASRHGKQATDYTLTVDVRNASGSYGTYGLMFGLAADWSQFYTFEIDPLGNYDVWQYDSTGWTLMLTGSSSHINKGSATNHIEVRTSQPQLYVNGYWLDYLHFGDFSVPTYMGLFVTAYDQPNLDVRFDNFTVDEATCVSPSGFNQLNEMPFRAPREMDLPDGNTLGGINARKE